MKKALSILLIMAMVLPVTFAVEAENTAVPSYDYEYAEDDWFIFAVLPGTKCGHIREYCGGDGALAEYYSFNGSAVADTDIACTGMEINYNHGQRRKIAVYGDVDGTGALNVGDTLKLRNLIMSSSTGAIGNNVNAKAGDVNYDGIINSADITLLNSYIMNDGIINGTAHFGIATDTVVDGTFDSTTLNTYLREMGYNRNNPVHTVDVYTHENSIIENLQTSTIYNYAGHGYTEGEYGTWITTDAWSGDHPSADDNVALTIADVQALPDDSLSNCRFAYFTSCYGALNGTNGYNILRFIKEKGVKTVIGHRLAPLTVTCKEWIEEFYNFSRYGHTVREAAFEANFIILDMGRYEDLAGAQNLVNMIVIFGDQDQRLAQPIIATDGVDWYPNNTLGNVTNSVASALNNNLRKEINQENAKGYYNLSALRDSGVRTFSTLKSRKKVAEEALSEYISIDKYDFANESYNESMEIYTLYYSKMINGLKSTDTGVVMLNKDGQVIGVKVINTDAFNGLALPDVTDEQIAAYLAQQNIANDYTLNGYVYALDENDNVAVDISVTTETENFSYLMPLS